MKTYKFNVKITRQIFCFPFVYAVELAYMNKTKFFHCPEMAHNTAQR